jgi:hypothetical protein
MIQTNWQMDDAVQLRALSPLAEEISSPRTCHLSKAQIGDPVGIKNAPSRLESARSDLFRISHVVSRDPPYSMHLFRKFDLPPVPTRDIDIP